MVYSSDFYTTRSYSRPITSSYTISYPVSSYSTGKSRIYTATSYPIWYSSPSYYRYSYTLPYVSSRVYRSPSPVRSVSPVRSITTTRIYRSESPTRTFYSYTSPLGYTRLTSSTLPYYSSYLPYRYIHYPYYRSYLGSPYTDRYLYYYPYIYKTYPESFFNFDMETRRIRDDANRLLLDIHSKVPHRTRSVTPYYTYDDAPISDLGLKSYISRITDPTRHLARAVRSMSLYPDTRKYMDVLKDLDPNRPTRKFNSSPKSLDDPDKDLKDKQRERAERLAAINEEPVKDNM